MSPSGALLNSLSDEDLVTEARVAGSHDTRAFETLVRRHQSFVAANCRAITRSPNDVEDLAQEVFVKAFFGLRRFEERASFRGWLHRIKVNHCLNHLRKNKGVSMVDIDDVDRQEHAAVTTSSDAHASLQAAGERERMFSILERMSDTLRLPLMLRDADGLSYEEIAAHLGIGLSAVKMRIKRGREEFRKHFGASEAAGRPSVAAGIP